MSLTEAAPTPVDDSCVTVRSDVWEVDVLPGTGASVAAGRVRTADGVWRDLLRPTPESVAGNPEKCASWPMIPWANRISGGLLRFGGRAWQLQRDAADLSAIHGATRYSPWVVVDRGAGHVEVELDTRGLVGVNFPWQFVARVRYAVTGVRLDVVTSLRNVDDEPFPAGFGHHPYFQRVLSPVGTPPVHDADGPLLQVPAHLGYRLHAGLSRGPAVPLAPRVDFRTLRHVGSALLDDVVTDLEPGEPVRLEYPGLAVDLTIDPVYSHLVLYAPRGRTYFAVEPQTMVNDGFALHARGVAGTGVLVLEPGEERTATFTLVARATA